MKHTDFMSLAGDKWNNLSEEEKMPYEKLAQKDKTRYETQMAEWKKKGYYIMEDGTKSNKDVPKNKKKSKANAESDEENSEEDEKPKKKEGRLRANKKKDK